MTFPWSLTIHFSITVSKGLEDVFVIYSLISLQSFVSEAKTNGVTNEKLNVFNMNLKFILYFYVCYSTYFIFSLIIIYIIFI